jgi:hypothetical protein
MKHQATKYQNPSLRQLPAWNAKHPFHSLYLMCAEHQCEKPAVQQCIPMQDYFRIMPDKERPLAGMRVSEAIGREAARLAHKGIYALDWNGENVCVIVGEEGDLEVSLRKNEYQACNEKHLLEYMPFAQLLVRKHFIAFTAAYNWEKNQLLQIDSGTKAHSNVAAV